jgi:AraC-like DNA-binding protein
MAPPSQELEPPANQARFTLKAYATAHRGAKLRKGLVSSDSVTEAIYDAGYGSSSRFYEKSTGLLGMTPTQYRAGGLNEEIRFAVGESSLGAPSSSRPARRALSRSCLVMILNCSYVIFRIASPEQS